MTKIKALSLSIVIPAYNEEGHLKACLDAVAKQTVKPLEVLVVDNNSTDKTVAIAKKYKFVTLLQETKQGAGYARTKGFNAARGEIIGRIDADSVITPNWVKHATDYLSSHPDELLTGGAYFYDLSMPRFFGWVMGQIAFRANRFIMGHYITWGSNMALTKDVWQKIKSKVHDQPELHEDMDLAIHAHQAGYEITYHTKWRVGASSRIYSRHPRGTHMDYLKMWPRTLRFHKLPRAWLGDLGVYIVWVSWWPLFTTHWLAGLFGRITGRRSQ